MFSGGIERPVALIKPVPWVKKVAIYNKVYFKEIERFVISFKLSTDFLCLQQ